MKARTHLSFGFLSALLFSPFFIADKIIFIILSMFGSLLPDIDKPGSTLGKKIKPLSWFFEQTLGHRTFSHSLLFVLLLILVTYPIIGLSYAAAISIGMLSHLGADSLTISGIRPFYPLHKFRVSGYIRTGGFSEKLFFIFILILVFILLF